MIIMDIKINNDIIRFTASLNRFRLIRKFDRDFVNGTLR